MLPSLLSKLLKIPPGATKIFVQQTLFQMDREIYYLYTIYLKKSPAGTVELFMLCVSLAESAPPVQTGKFTVRVKLSRLIKSFLFLVADMRLYILPGRSVGRSVRPSHFWIPSGFRITAPAQTCMTGLLCIRPRLVTCDLFWK